MGERIPWRRSNIYQKPPPKAATVQRILPAFQGILHDNAVTAVLVLSDGRVVTSSLDCTLRIWNKQVDRSRRKSSMECAGELRGHVSGVLAILSLANNQLASSSADQTIRVWDLASSASTLVLEAHEGAVSCLAQLPDGLLVSGGEDKTIRVWDLTDGSSHLLNDPENDVSHSRTVRCLVPLHDGMLGSSSHEGEVWFWVKGAQQHSFWSCKLKLVLGSVFMQLPNWKFVATSKVDSGRILKCFTANMDADEEEESITLVTQLRGHTDNVRAIMATYSGLLLTAADDRTARVWSTSAGKCRAVLEGHSAAVACIAQGPDGQVITGAWNGELCVWEAECFGGGPAPIEPPSPPPISPPPRSPRSIVPHRSMDPPSPIVSPVAQYIKSPLQTQSNGSSPGGNE